MKHEVFTILYVIVMGVLIICVDVFFLRDHFWWRLGTNITIVALFVLAYFLFFKQILK